MTAKEYLREIEKMDVYINQRQTEYNDLLKNRTYIGSMNYSDEKVQNSSNCEGFTKVSDKLFDLQKEINTMIDEFYDLKHERISQIQQLSKVEYSKILFMLYVQYLPFEKVSEEIRLSYYRICHLHGEALKEFTNKFLKVSN